MCARFFVFLGEGGWGACGEVIHILGCILYASFVRGRAKTTRHSVASFA